MAMYPDDTGVFYEVVVAGGGIFVYSPSPGAGNLVASIIGSAGTDPYGNAYLAGETEYSQAGPTAVNLNLNHIAWYTAPSSAGPWTQIALMFINPASTPADVLTIAAGTPPLLIKSGTGGANPSSSGVLEVAGLTTITSGGLSVTGGETADTIAVSSGQAAGNVLKVTNTTAAPTFPSTELIAAAAADRVLGMQVTGDTNNRLVMTASNPSGTWFEGSGSAGADISYGRTAANKFGVTTADLDIRTAGRGLQVAEGANAKQGIATLSGGTILVANTSVTANSRIMLTPQDNSTTGALRVSARVAGTSFTITSSNAGDSGVVAYQIFEPG